MSPEYESWLATVSNRFADDQEARWHLVAVSRATELMAEVYREDTDDRLWSTKSLSELPGATFARLIAAVEADWLEPDPERPGRRRAVEPTAPEGVHPSLENLLAPYEVRPEEFLDQIYRPAHANMTVVERVRQLAAAENGADVTAFTCHGFTAIPLDASGFRWRMIANEEAAAVFETATGWPWEDYDVDGAEAEIRFRVGKIFGMADKEGAGPIPDDKMKAQDDRNLALAASAMRHGQGLPPDPDEAIPETGDARELKLWLDAYSVAKGAKHAPLRRPEDVFKAL